VTTAKQESATLAACLTPPGAGAIAVLAVRGVRAWEIACSLFHPRLQKTPWPPDRVETGRSWLGKFGNGIADEVVLAVRRTEPYPWVEVQCHGGAEVIRWLLETLTKRGIEVCSWQELEHRTAADLLQATALAALAEALTTRTAAIVLDQYHGAFRREVHHILAALDREDSKEAGQWISSLAQRTKLGRHLTQPWRVAVLGPVNVGKSSLVNALVGSQRSIVAAAPGTTRDVVTSLIALGGWPIELADTAGMRSASEALEQQGIDLARAAGQSADLRLWVMDVAEPPLWPPAGQEYRVVVNKADRPPAWDAKEGLRVSALTGAGVHELGQQLAQWLVPAPPPAGAAVPFTPWLCDRIEKAQQLLLQGDLKRAHSCLTSTLMPPSG
jgi:tRNA modification GTPase